MATNRIETLDPALLRPGRIDRKIEFPLPDQKTKRRIFGIHTGRMNLADDVNIEEFVMSKEELSGADIKAVCTEAGLLALRERRMRITQARARASPLGRAALRLPRARLPRACACGRGGAVPVGARFRLAPWRPRGAQADFKKAKDKVLYKKKEGVPEGLYL